MRKNAIIKTTAKTQLDKVTLFVTLVLAFSLPIVQINVQAFENNPEKKNNPNIETISKKALLGQSDLLDLIEEEADAVPEPAKEEIEAEEEEDSEDEKADSEDDSGDGTQSKNSSLKKTNPATSSTNTNSGNSSGGNTAKPPSGHWEQREKTPERVVDIVVSVVCMCGAEFPNKAAWEAHRPHP